jgi:cytoskeletal protein CcmA (bactofilin family)
MSRLRSNKVVNQAGSGAPELTYGAVVPGTGTISGAGKVSIGGSITAASFHGDGSSLSGIDASALKDGSNTKVQAISTGANVTGNLVATGNVTAVDGTFSGNATVQGNLTVNGTTTTIDTAVTAVDSLAVDGHITAGGNVSLPDSSSASDGRVRFGAGNDLQIYHDGSNSYINESGLGVLKISSNRVEILSGSGESCAKFQGDAGAEIYYDNSKRIETTADGVDILGTGSIKVPVGTTAQRNGSPTAGDFRYNSTEGKFEGYTTEWGEIGGGGGGLTTAAHVANNAVVTLDLTAAVDHKVTATGICTITCTGGTEAQSHTIRIINNGSATVGFSTYFLFPSGNTPVLPSTDGAINLISFTVNRVGVAGTQLLAGASLNFS